MAPAELVCSNRTDAEFGVRESALLNQNKSSQLKSSAYLNLI